MKKIIVLKTHNPSLSKLICLKLREVHFYELGFVLMPDDCFVNLN